MSISALRLKKDAASLLKNKLPFGEVFLAVEKNAQRTLKDFTCVRQESNYFRTPFTTRGDDKADLLIWYNIIPHPMYKSMHWIH